MKNVIRMMFLAAIVAASGSAAMAASLLVVEGPGGGGFGGYSDISYSTYRTTLNNAFGGAANVTLTPDLTNAAQVNSHTAIVVELRNGTDILSPVEKINMANFLASGRRVFMIGENQGWQTWDQSLLDVVGGTYVGQSPSQGPDGDVTNYHVPLANLNHPLLDGVLSEDNEAEVFMFHGSVASGGTALFEWAPIAMLWGDQLNALTYFSNNEFYSSELSQHPGNLNLTQNIAEWLAVPEPASMSILAFGGLAVLRRRRKQ
jgi:hypothetical protein